MKTYKTLCALMLTTSLLGSAGVCAREKDFGSEKKPTFTGPSGLWIKGPLRRAKGADGGEVKAQLFMRYADVPSPFTIGSINYLSYDLRPGQDNAPEEVKQALMRAYKLDKINVRRWKQDTWVFESLPRQGERFLRSYMFIGKNRYAVSTAVLRHAYLDSTFVESEWLQMMMVERERLADDTRITWSWPAGLSFIASAHAQDSAKKNCPVVGGGVAGVPTCPSSASCAGLSMMAYQNCMANVSACNTTSFTSAANGMTVQVAGMRQDLHCQIGNLQAWGDTKQEWVEDSLLPRADRFQNQLDSIIGIGNDLTNPLRLAGIAALGTVVATVATSAVGLVATGLGTGLEELYKQVSGKSKEEDMRERAKLFVEAETKWKEMNEDLEGLENAIDSSIDLFEIVRASGHSLEDFIGANMRDLAQRKFEISRTQRSLERSAQADDGSSEAVSCHQYWFDKQAQEAAGIKDLEAVLKALGDFKKEYTTFDLGCQSLAGEIGKLMAQEAAIEKARSRMTSFYAAKLWVENMDDKAIEENLVQNPNQVKKTEMESAHAKFYAKWLKNTISPRKTDDYDKGEEINCAKIIDKLAQECRGFGIPILNFLYQAPQGDFNKCALSVTGAYAHTDVTNKAQKNSNPKDLGFLLGSYAPAVLAQGTVDELFDDPSETLCVRNAVDAYKDYSNTVAQVEMRYDVAVETYNYRITNQAADAEAQVQLTNMINSMNVESFCMNVAHGGCLPGDTYCQEDYDKKCHKESQRLWCASKPSDKTACKEHVSLLCQNPKDESEGCERQRERYNTCVGSNEKACGSVSPACRDPDDKSDYCRFQKEQIGACQESIKSCQESDFPLGCQDGFQSSCEMGCDKMDQDCADLDQAVARQREKNSSCGTCREGDKACAGKLHQCLQKASTQVKGSMKLKCQRAKVCHQDQMACLETKKTCIKSAYGNAKFRFERFKTMREYMDKGLCNFPKAKKEESAKSQ